MTKDETMKLAMEALELVLVGDILDMKKIDNALTALSEAEDSGISAKLVAMDFSGDETELTFGVPHGTEWTAGTYTIIPPQKKEGA